MPARAGTAPPRPLATADLDGDGYTDLLVGAPSESVGTDDHQGSLTLVWGGAAGLGSGATVKPSYVPDDGCTFAEGLATGDTDGNGAPDVVVGSRCSAQYFFGPFTRTGTGTPAGADHQLGTTHTAVVGNVDGDGSAERVMLPGRYSDDPGGRVYLDNWNDGRYTRTELTGADGTVGAVTDTNGDGKADLTVGIPTENASGCTWNALGTAVTGSFCVCAPAFSLSGGYQGLGAVLAP
ncbi:FG-GAP repeat protein [Streptomyces longispororuber]|uniref:FG-GAP repeat protein n=1 Tax=Streptomyces longispororuber TaxID=68230 RepID=UPI0021086C7E|nr:FG-GAP repeat protein [Streptomyces longispororuber]MCQ4207816.1 FG-GAP repeat protein [Streptomyces longispororuber]